MMPWGNFKVKDEKIKWRGPRWCPLATWRSGPEMRTHSLRRQFKNTQSTLGQEVLSGREGTPRGRRGSAVPRRGRPRPAPSPSPVPTPVSSFFFFFPVHPAFPSSRPGRKCLPFSVVTHTREEINGKPHESPVFVQHQSWLFLWWSFFFWFRVVCDSAAQMTAVDTEKKFTVTTKADVFHV